MILFSFPSSSSPSSSSIGNPWDRWTHALSFWMRRSNWHYWCVLLLDCACSREINHFWFLELYCLWLWLVMPSIDRSQYDQTNEWLCFLKSDTWHNIENSRGLLERPPNAKTQNSFLLPVDDSSCYAPFTVFLFKYNIYTITLAGIALASPFF